MSKNKKLSKDSKSISNGVNTNQVKPKFKIGDIVFDRCNVSGEFIITHIYLKHGVISYRVVRHNSLFHTMANELIDEPESNDSLTLEEMYLEYL